jgi:hypothetical protein
LIATAHHSLGYKTPITPLSPEDDSIRAAWRSASQACLDIPDYGSTISPSPATKRRRMQSAPDVLQFGLKASPPTPPTSSPVHMASGGGRRLDGLMNQNGDDIVRTPISSPGQLGSPLEVSQEARTDASGHDRNTAILLHPLPPTPPPSSPVRASQTTIIPHFLSDHDTSQYSGHKMLHTPPRRPKKVKPLSLRSRLKLAARRSIAVA